MSRAERQRGPHHPRLAAATALGLAVALIAAISGAFLPRNETLWHLVAGPPEDGAWIVDRIDGADVGTAGYSLAIRWRKIVGFSDGCNNCGFNDDKPSGAPNRMLDCTLVACTPKQHDRPFRQLTSGVPTTTIETDRLILVVPGHRAELVRAPKDGVS